MTGRASRQNGIEASTRSAFSLIEVLIAIFILAIGVLGIAALFPAGIAQQRRSVDDTVGPIVAENALAVIRSKVKPEFFAEEPPRGLTPFPVRLTLEGDWMWRRPLYFLQDATISLDVTDAFCTVIATRTVNVPAGSISLFADFPQTSDFDELPLVWSRDAFPCEAASGTAPTIIITQRERFYPQVPEGGRPQFAWDCMFRRHEGKMLVAIFVYRVTAPGGGGVPFRVVYDADNNPQVADLPPIPVRLRLTASNAWDAGQGANFNDPTDPGDPFMIPGTAPIAGNENPIAVGDRWQYSGQILLDQNNQVHRVLSGREVELDGPVELSRPVNPVLGNPFDPFPGVGLTESPNYYFGLPRTDLSLSDYGMVFEDVVTDVWYLPDTMSIDVNTDGVPEATYTLTPVYVTVREL